jgi:hypothetical protein
VWNARVTLDVSTGVSGDIDRLAGRGEQPTRQLDPPTFRPVRNESRDSLPHSQGCIRHSSHDFNGYPDCALDTLNGDAGGDGDNDLVGWVQGRTNLAENVKNLSGLEAYNDEVRRANRPPVVARYDEVFPLHLREGSRVSPSQVCLFWAGDSGCHYQTRDH